MRPNIILFCAFCTFLFLAAASCGSSIESRESLPLEGSDGAGLDLVESENNSSSEVASSGKILTVVFDGQKFLPANLTIRVGDTVNFVNDSEVSMHPAAGPHPIHTSVPGFDAKKSLRQGESFRFTFTKPQVVSFHNHQPYLPGGTITVAE